MRRNLRTRLRLLPAILLSFAGATVAVSWVRSHKPFTPYDRLPGPWKDGATGLVPLHTYLYYPDSRNCFYLTPLEGWVRAGQIHAREPFDAPRDNGGETRWGLWRLVRIPEPMLMLTRKPGILDHVLLYECLPYASGFVRGVAVPHWLLVVACWSWPFISLTRSLLQRRRRARRGFCLKCGYNLTGNTSGRCPECGSELQP